MAKSWWDQHGLAYLHWDIQTKKDGDVTQGRLPASKMKTRVSTSQRPSLIAYFFHGSVSFPQGCGV